MKVKPDTPIGLPRLGASYVRQSVASNDKSEASPQVQRVANKAEAERRGNTFTRHYEDIGVSGWNPDAERKGFEEMLADARAGKFNELVVYYISRFSRREPQDAIPVVMELHRLGVTIVSVTEGVFPPNDTMALVMLIIRLDQAHSESQTKSKNIRAVKQTARDLGGWTGGQAPYGFRTEKILRESVAIQLLRHEPEEAENIRRIWAAIKEHMGVPIKHGQFHPGSLSGQCKWMNDNGIPTRGQRTGKERKNTRWDSRTLKRIMMDPRLAGYGAFPVYRTREDGSPTRTVLEYRMVRDPETMEPIKVCEPILEPAEWFALQEWLKGRDRGQGLSRGVSLLSSLKRGDQAVLLCECGRPMTSLNSKAENAKPVYRCTRPSGGTFPGQHEGGNAVMQTHLDDHVARRIFSVIMTAEDDPEALAVLREAARRFSRANESPQRSMERTSLVAERADAQRALNELYDDLDSGIYDGKTGRARFLGKKGVLEARLEGAQSRLAELAEPESAVLPIAEWLPADPDADPIGPGSWWASAERDEKREFITLFVDSIVVSKAATRWGHARRASYDVGERIEVEFAKPLREAEELPQA